MESWNAFFLPILGIYSFLKKIMSCLFSCPSLTTKIRGLEFLVRSPGAPMLCQVHVSVSWRSRQGRGGAYKHPLLHPMLQMTCLSHIWIPPVISAFLWLYNVPFINILLFTSKILKNIYYPYLCWWKTTMCIIKGTKSNSEFWSLLSHLHIESWWSLIFQISSGCPTVVHKSCYYEGLLCCQQLDPIIFTTFVLLICNKFHSVKKCLSI